MQLCDQQVKQFETEGYLFFPDIFARQEIGRLNDELPSIFAQRREENIREKSSDAVRTAFAVHTYNESFGLLARHPRLVRPVMQLLNGPVYMHQFKINAKAAFNGDAWQWHQDFGTWTREDLMPEPRAMNISVFLDDVNEFNGPLLLIPKSHQQGNLEAGHDVTTTSYPLWTLDSEAVTRLGVLIIF